MSYANMIMYGSVLPSYSGGKGAGGGADGVINADNPANRDLVKNILFG